MQKELDPMRQLEQRRETLSKGIGRINDIYLSDPVRIGKVEVGSSLSATLEVGRTKAAARKAVVGLGNKLEEVNNELMANDARDYLRKVNEMERGLPEIGELVAAGNLPEDILRKHQQEFEELQKLPEDNPLLQRAIEWIRQEEEARRKEEAKDIIEILPDGRVRLPNRQEIGGRMGELLGLLADTSVDNPRTSDQLGRAIYSDANDRIVISRVHALIGNVRNRLIGTGVELVGIRVVRVRRGKARYYLRRADQSEQSVEQAKPDQGKGRADEGFRFEDVQVVTGEEGRCTPLSRHQTMSV